MQPGGGIGSGIGGNLVGPNSGIFQGGPAMGNPMMGGGGGGLGPFPPRGGGGMIDPFAPGGMMFHQPEGFGDLDPGLPDDPLRIGGVRRPPNNRMMGPNNGMGGMFGPGGNLGPGGGFGGGMGGGFGGGGPGGNMYM